VAAHAVITTGSSKAAFVSVIPRTCSTTKPTNPKFRRYSKIVMPETVRRAAPPGVQPQVEPGLIPRPPNSAAPSSRWPRTLPATAPRRQDVARLKCEPLWTSHALWRNPGLGHVPTGAMTLCRDVLGWVFTPPHRTEASPGCVVMRRKRSGSRTRLRRMQILPVGTVAWKPS
jgi:hypothetical protein